MLLSFTRYSRLLKWFHQYPVAGYGFAALLFVSALALRFEMEGMLPPGFPFLTFFPAVVIAAFLCGTGPGILSAVLGFFSAWYFFVAPLNSFALTQQSAAALGFYLIVIGVNLVIIDQLMKASSHLARERALAVRLAEEKKTLFSEAQHRIGNNLQTISSLLQIQSRVIGDPEAKRALVEAIQRVSVIADIQRKFHNSDQNGGTIDTAFVTEIAQGCISAAGLEDQFTLSAVIEPLTLPQDSFLAVTLVLTECVNNALEHGNRNDGKSSIHVNLAKDSSSASMILEVRDNGPGIPVDFNPAASNSIGLKVVRSFTQQLNGTFGMTGECGTTCRLVFPLQQSV
jgi:two-component system, sensor histidine kinase PdtaS